MIACSWLYTFSIWGLTAASIITSAHLWRVDREHLKLRRRVHHLEMSRDYPWYDEHNREEIERDRWA